MPKINLTKQQGGVFTCSTQQDYELAKSWKVGQSACGKFDKPRNGKFHRKCFSLLNFVFQNQSQHKNFNDLRSSFCIDAGHIETYFDFNAVRHIRVRSMDYSSLDDADFGILFDKFIDIALLQFGDKMNESELKRYIDEVIGYT